MTQPVYSGDGDTSGKGVFSFLPSQGANPTETTSAAEAEGGDATLKVLATRTPHAEWPPARRFWASFLIADPLCLSPMGDLTSTAVSMARHMEDVDRLSQAQAPTIATFNEKLKAISAFAVCRAAVICEAAGGTPEDVADLRRILTEVREASAQDFAALWPRWSGLVEDNGPFPLPPEANRGAWSALSLAPPAYLRALSKERRRLDGGRV